MHTYSSFRYLDWINESQAVAILTDYQKKSAEVRMILDSDTLTYSRNEAGDFRVSSLTGTLDEVAQWVNLEKESIYEYTKNMGVRYDLILGVKQADKLDAAPRVKE